MHISSLLLANPLLLLLDGYGLGGGDFASVPCLRDASVSKGLMATVQDLTRLHVPSKDPGLRAASACAKELATMFDKASRSVCRL